MRRSKNQIIYSALPGQFITFSSSRRDKENCKRADQCVINVRKWNTKRIEKNEIYFPKIVGQIKKMENNMDVDVAQHEHSNI